MTESTHVDRNCPEVDSLTSLASESICSERVRSQFLVLDDKDEQLNSWINGDFSVEMFKECNDMEILKKVIYLFNICNFVGLDDNLYKDCIGGRNTKFTDELVAIQKYFKDHHGAAADQSNLCKLLDIYVKNKKEWDETMKATQQEDKHENKKKKRKNKKKKKDKKKKTEEQEDEED
jgi:hypothetical protein